MTDRTPEPRSAFPHFLTIPTRWMDNDVYGHVNNVNYYSYFDTVICHYLIHEGGLDMHTDEIVGVCAESHCLFLKSFSFPELVQAGLRVGHLGNKSVRYEIGLFQEGDETAAAQGWFVHVFVTRPAMQAVPIPERMRTALAALQPT